MSLVRIILAPISAAVGSALADLSTSHPLMPRDMLLMAGGALAAAISYEWMYFRGEKKDEVKP